MQATCTRPPGDRGAGAARDTRYRRPVAPPRSSALAPLVIVVRRGCATRRTGEQWRYHDRWGGSGPVARVPGEAAGSERPRLTPDSRQPPGCSFLRRRTASEEGPAGRGPAPEGAVSAEIPPYAAQATPGQENRGPKDGG